MAHHFFTGAGLQLRDDPDEWESVAAYAGVGVDRLRLLSQVHGAAVVTAGTEPSLPSRPAADAIIGRGPTQALIVRVADCAPILLADRRLGVVAAVHAGWRGTMHGIVGAAIRTLSDQYASHPHDLVAAVGPSLGRCCGEMGEEVVAAFTDAGHRRSIERWFTREPGRRPHFDLWQATRDQLEWAGVPAGSIHVSGLCTRSHPNVFHSYRAAGPAAGRMAAVIVAPR